MSDQAAHLRAVPDAVGGAGEADDGPPSSEGDPTGITPPRSSGKGSRFLSDVIVELNMLPPERVRAATEEAKAAGQTLEQVLSVSGALTSDQLARAVAERFGLDHVDLTVYKPDLAAANLIKPQAARRLGAVPIGFDAERRLLVAMADPSNVLALDDLKLMTGHAIRPAVSSAQDIADVIARMTRLEDAVAEASEEESEGEEEAVVSDIRESAEDAPVIKLVNSIVAEAVEENASDIHLEPDGREMRIRFRVDGVLAKRTMIPRRMVPGVISRVKIMGDLDISERRLPQDGRTG
jgi:type IV pilus assembly protein PilB